VSRGLLKIRILLRTGMSARRRFGLSLAVGSVNYLKCPRPSAACLVHPIVLGSANLLRASATGTHAQLQPTSGLAFAAGMSVDISRTATRRG
jgi:hypothetical protein